MAEHLNVFISSTSKDLEPYRDLVAKVARRLGLFPIMMEDFNPTDRGALQKCYDEMCKAELFIGIYAHRYGTAAPATMRYKTEKGDGCGDDTTSFTHWEYLWAVERKLPRRCFLVSDKDGDGKPIAWPDAYKEDDPGKTRLKEFKDHLQKTEVVNFFYSPDNLAWQAATALAETLLELERLRHLPLPPRRADFYRHIRPPEKYVPREDLMGQLRLALLGDESVALTSALTHPAKDQPTALHGLGGIGKSVMARALCDDAAVQRAFPDGILWARLGKDAMEADIRQRLSEWLGALGGSVPEGVPSLETLQNALAEALKERACLLMVDDVWRRKDVEAFRLGGARCRLVFTTRDAEIAREVGAVVHKIPPMTRDEALALLDEWAQGTLVVTDEALKIRIVERLARLPLAIKLAGAQLQRTDPAEWLRRFDARKLKSARPEDPHDSLEQTFGLSLDELSDEERRLYNALSIFKEDEPIHEAAICRLWSSLGRLGEDEVAALVDDLAARALVEAAGTQYPRAVILHDLLRDFMKDELGNPIPAHEVLLEAYRRQRLGDGWHTLPEDGYIHGHLAYHLEAAGRSEELYALLTGSRDWMDAQNAALAGDQGFAADLDNALSSFHDPLLDAESALNLIRLWTARHVVNARVESYSDDALRAMVLIDIHLRKDGQWTTKAFSYARLRNKGIARVKGLIQIAEVLSISSDTRASQVLDEAHWIALHIRDIGDRSSALRDVSTAMSRLCRFDEASDAAHQIEDSAKRVNALSGLAAAMAQVGDNRAYQFLEEARVIAGQIEDSVDRAFALTGLASAMAQVGDHRVNQVLDDAEKAANQIEYGGYRVSALTDLGEAMAHAGFGRTDQIFDNAMDLVTADDFFYDFFPQDTTSLINLASALAYTNRFEKSNQVISYIRDDQMRISAYGMLADAMVRAGDERADQVFELLRQTALQIEGGWSRARALGDLAVAMVNTGRFEEVQSVISMIDPEFYEAAALADLATMLAQANRFDEAQLVANQIHHDQTRAFAMCQTAAAMARAHDEHADQVFGEALQLIAQFRDKPDVEAITFMATALAQAGDSRGIRLIQEARAVADQIEHYEFRAAALKTLATRMAQIGQFEEARAIADQIEDDMHRASALSALAAAMAQEGDLHADKIFSETRMRIDGIAGYEDRESALRDLAAALAKADRCDQAQEVIKLMGTGTYRESALQAVVSAMALAGHIDKAQAIAHQIQDKRIHAYALCSVVDNFAHMGRYDEARKLADQIIHDGARAYALVALANALTQARDQRAHQTFDDAETLITQLEDDWIRDSAMRQLAASLAETDQLVAAFALTMQNKLDGFMASLAVWRAAFKRFGSDVHVSALCEAVRIAGWVSPSWQRVHAILSEPAPPPAPAP